MTYDNDNNGNEDSTKLRSMLEQHKASQAPEPIPEDDPYGEDLIARRYIAPLQKYLDRPDIKNIKEIIINKPEEVGLEFADGSWEWIEDKELPLEVLEDIARMLANRSGQLFHPGNPMLSVKMPGGHRVQICSGFNSPTGFIMAIRLQRKETFGIDDFVMSDEDRASVIECVKTQKTMLISGGTSTGKTSFLNAILPYIPDDERIITLEDVPELKVVNQNWAQLLFAGNDTTMGGQSVIDLINACLRLRPDRIMLGEIRKENAFAFCSAINTGHEGSIATIHANDPKMALDAVINRVLMNGDMPESALSTLRRQLIHDIYSVVQLTRVGPKVHARYLVLNSEQDLI